MSVGLIQDMNMDNMKSLEQDIHDHQPSLQMNDEKKAKQEMYVFDGHSYVCFMELY